MRESCNVCGLVFLREAGYFLGAMYISYTFGLATILPICLALYFLADWPLTAVLGVLVVLALVTVPVFLRYSRLIWLYADQMIDPR